MADEEQKQFIYGLCDPGETMVRYIGRAKNATERRRQHVQLSHGDFSPKGVWVKYLELEGVWPDQVILDEREFGDAGEAEAWAKSCEKEWIKKFRDEGNYVLNNGCWWHHPDRKVVPKSTRFAWQQLHHIFFRLQFWLNDADDSYIEITRFQAVRAIREMVKQYPSLEVRPVSVLDQVG